MINEVSYSERLDWPEGRPRTPASARLPGLAANPSASSPTYAIRRIQRALDRAWRDGGCRFRPTWPSRAAQYRISADRSRA